MNESTINPDASPNELGLHVQLGYEIVAQSVAYPFPRHYVDQIRMEIDPDFVPLWVNRIHRTPNDGLVWTGHHMIARHVRNPRAEAPVIPGLRLPVFRTYGIRYENPLLEADILDGLTEKERNQGVLPRYVPFTGAHVEAMRYSMWQRNNRASAERIRVQKQIQTRDALRVKQFNNSEAVYRRHHDDNRLKRADGTADRVYVSDTLTKLRAAAGAS